MLTGKKRVIVLCVLSAIAGLVYLTPFLRFSFYDQMQEALQLTDIQIGSIGFIYGFFNVVSYVPTGFLAEKFNTKKLLVISTLGMCVMTIWYSFYPGFTAIMVIHAMYGIFSVGTFWSPYLKAIRSLASEEQQGTIFGLSEGLRGMAQTAVAFICLGVLGAVGTVTVGFRAILWVNAAVFALLTVAVIVLVPDFDKERAEQAAAAGEEVKSASTIETLKAFPKALTNPSIWICIFIVMCGFCLWSSINGYLGTYCTRVLQIPANISSGLSIIRSYIVVFVAGISGGFIVDRFKTKGLAMAVAFAGAAISAAGVLLTHNMMYVCIIVTIVLAYMVNVLKATYWSILGDAGIPLEATGIATGVISLIGLTPDFFAAPIISRFIAYGESVGNVELGFNMMLIWLVVWAVLGILGGLILKKKKENMLKAAVK